MVEVINYIFGLFNLSFNLFGFDLSVGSIVLGTILISFVSFVIGKIFN